MIGATTKKSSKQGGPPGEIPDVSLLDDPDYAAALQKFSNLRQKSSELDERLDKARRERREMTAEHDPVDERLDKIGDGDPDAIERALSNGSGQGSLSAMDEAVKKIQKQRVSISELLVAQKKRLDRVQALAARKLAEEVRPQYTALLEEMAEKAVELGRLADQEAEFFRFLRDNRVPGFEPPAGLPKMRLFEGVEQRGPFRNPTASDLTRWLDKVQKHYGVKVER